MSIAGQKAAVEVKTASGVGDPSDHFDDRKQRQVRMLAAQRGIARVDYIGVRVSARGATVHWLPRVC